MKLYLLSILLLVSINASASSSDLPLTDTMHLIGAAAEAAPKGVKGEFTFVIQATSRLGNKVYLNTQPDHRDQRNVSIVLSSSVVSEFDSKNETPAEEFLINKKLNVTGVAGRVKINLHCESRKTEKYYYQTHVPVLETSQINILGTVPSSVEKVDNMSAFEKDVKRYLSYKNFKAYAMAFGEKSGWVSGYGYNYSTQEEADERALLACEKHRESRELKRICKIRARGDVAPQMPWGNSSYSGCDDPKYADYVASRRAGFESSRKKRYEEALHKLTETPYDGLSNTDKFRYVRNNTVLSARFDTEEVALENIRRLNSGLINSDFFFIKDDDIPHQTNIARGWLALKKGDTKQAIHYLLESTLIQGSPVLGSFGPDTSLMSELYVRGHKKAVLEYLKRTDEFWNTEDAMEKKAIWRVMANNDCPIQFQFYDTTNFEKLGLQLD